MSTKIHMAVRGLGCPVRFVLTAGQKGDAPQAEALLADLPAEVVMADAAYDSDAIREVIAAKGALAVIPNNPSRAQRYPGRRAPLRDAVPDRVLLLQAQAVPTRRHPIREDRKELSRRRHDRRSRPVDTVSVHSS